MTGALSPVHWMIILVVLLLLFGAKRLPDTARGVGKALRIFKAETSALSAEGEKTAPPATAPTQAPAAVGQAPAEAGPAVVGAPARSTSETAA